MFNRGVYRRGLYIWASLHLRNISNVKGNMTALYYLRKHLNISESKAKYILLKNPAVEKISESRIQSLIDTLHTLGYSKEVLIEEPLMLVTLPITLKFRYQVLNECGMNNISPRDLASYLTIVKQKSIQELKKSGDIPSMMNIENRLASYMTQWPTSLTTLIYGDVNEYTLYSLRMKIIQRYLELMLDLSKEEFYRGLQTYPTIKHRPLGVINETLNILQSQIMMPTHKLKSNLYLVHADPENLKQIICNFRFIGGIDIKEVIRMHPKLATKSLSTLIETWKILKDYNISNEAQIRCFEIYTLGPCTIRERLEKAKTIPEFQSFLNHPRYLKIIYYNSTVMKRLTKLHNSNKKCLSLNVLSGSSAHYETFEKAPGDRLGKGKDLVFCVAQCLGKEYSMNGVRNHIKKHPFWINIPLVHIRYVFQQLSNQFTPKDIYQNCPILFYPWSRIKDVLQILDKRLKKKQVSFSQDQLDLTKLSNTQKLSLVLYLLEKNHYFTGNGVWIEEKSRITDMANLQEDKS